MSMKFGRLLAAGKSMEDRNVIGRYQVRPGLALPQFISPKNPFKQDAAVKPTAPPLAAVAPALRIELEQPVAVEKQAEQPPQPKPTKAKLAQRAGNCLRALGNQVKQASLFCLDHNPFSAIGRPRVLGIPRFGKPQVQGELSLDRVKVVRNDLAHADLEVVRAGGSK